jgi:RNA polymerase sigma factor (TIGR02999 family)
MDMPSPKEVTELLLDWREGNQEAIDRLMPLVYNELRRLAAYHMKRERPDHTLQASALINEVYLRLVDQKSVSWQNRAHFFGIASRLMREVLVDHARSRNYAKRGGDRQKVDIEKVAELAQENSPDLIALDDALKSLASIDERQSRIVELRFFGGLTSEETAEVLGISLRTVEREWNMARAWLSRQMVLQS